MTRFGISATGHSLNYLPQYLASSRGYFADEGIDVDVTVPTPWDRVVSDLRSGVADAALGGIWVPAMYANRGDRLVPFAQVAARAPLAVLGRNSSEPFRWPDLRGKTVLMKGSNGASVGLYFKMLLRENGVDPGSVNYVQDLDAAMLSELFVEGLGDHLVIDYLSAARLAGRTAARLDVALVLDGGDVPWSVYYSRGESDPDRVGVQERFARALNRGMRWVMAHEAASYADLLGATFPDYDVDLLVRLTDEFRMNGMWTSPHIDRTAYKRWQRGVCDGHLIEEPIAYDTLVDPRPTAFCAT